MTDSVNLEKLAEEIRVMQLTLDSLETELVYFQVYHLNRRHETLSEPESQALQSIKDKLIAHQQKLDRLKEQILFMDL